MPAAEGLAPGDGSPALDIDRVGGDAPPAMEGRVFITPGTDSEFGAVVGLPFDETADDPNAGIAGRTVSLGVRR